MTRLGRWIDFKNDYKTLYPWFMESIWYMIGYFVTVVVCYHGDVFTGGCSSSYMTKDWFTVATRYSVF